MNGYFQHENLDAFTTARSADVNALGQGVEAGFDKLPAEDRFNRTLVDPVTAGGSANVITVALDPAITVYQLGQRISFIAAHDNTGAVTVNVNGVGAVEMVREDGASLEADDLSAGSIYDAIYNGSDFQLLRGTGGQLAGYVAAAAASAEAAEDSATAAAISAGGASGSASMAMSYANQADAAKDDALAAQAAAEAAQSAAETAEGNAASDAASASASAGAAAASELAASGSASDAAASETAAAGSALAASGSASAADASATEAENAKTAAEAAQSAAESAQSGAEAAQGAAESAQAAAEAAAADAENQLVPDQTGNAGKYLATDGTSPFWDDLDVGATNWGAIAGTLSDQTDLQAALNAKQAADADLDLWAAITPASGIGTFLATPSSANLAGAVTDETGSGALVFATSPTLVTPVLGTPSSGTLTNCTGLPMAGLVASTSTAIGVGSINIGHASDTTVSRASAGDIAVEGNRVFRVGGADVPVADGGTGASNAAGARTNLGAAITNAELTALVAVFDGGASQPATGADSRIYASVPFGCTILEATIIADASGSAVVDIWKDTYANYPPTIADTITASAKPTLSSAIKNSDATLSGWTTTITAGDCLVFNLDSVTTCKKVTVVLKVRKT